MSDQLAEDAENITAFLADAITPAALSALPLRARAMRPVPRTGARPKSAAAQRKAARARAAARRLWQQAAAVTGAETAASPAAQITLPPFDVTALLEAQLAAISEPAPLTEQEIAELPVAGEPDVSQTPWWLTAEFSGTDEAEQASWEATLPPDLRALYQQDEPPPDQLPAGFTRYDRDAAGSRAAGFGAGADLDVMAPCPQLAAAAHTVTAAGPQRLGEAELIGVLCAWQRLTAWAQASQAACLAALITRRKDQSVQLSQPDLAAHVGDETAAALTLTAHAAGRLLSAAQGLARLPSVHTALAQGRIDWPKSQLFTELLAGLPDADASAIADTVLATADRKTTGQLRAALTRAVLAYDPESAQRRRQAARKNTSVQLWDETSGNTALAGRELARADAIHASARLTEAARWLHHNGADGTTDELRAAAYIALLTGRPFDTLLPDGSQDADPATSTADSTTADVPDADASSDGASPAAPGISNHSSGDGSADADGTIGDVLDADASNDRMAETSAGATSDPRRESLPDRSVQPPLSGTINLTMPLSAWTGESDLPGDVAGHGTADAATCRDLAARARPFAAWCLTLTDPGGRAVAHACASGAPPPGPLDSASWAASLRARIQLLESGTCSHARSSPRYRPPPNLVHLIRVRQRTCSFPGCRRPAVRCDLDHTLAFEKGGLTCECNLAPLCRAHHRAKQTTGWHLAHNQPGQLTWTTPAGRSYTTTPELYPV